MDPLLLVAEWWWIAPTAAGAGAVGVLGVRRRGTVSGRRLGYEAARSDLKSARRIATETRVAVKVARADLAHISAQRAARTATPEQVAGAKRMLREKERQHRAAVAEVRARQARLSAARSEIPRSSGPGPLERMHAAHDAVTARWMQYETDAARQIAYPAMIDVKRPETAAYLRAAAHANECRRAASGRVTPTDFAAYRDAVAGLERTFELAEHAAKVQAGEAPPAPAWQDAAQEAITRSAEALDRAAGAAASAIAAWTNRGRSGRPD